MQQLRIVRHVRLGLKTLMLHKLRSLLTVLGVVFGVGSVIAMLSVGEGASRQQLEQIRKLGSTNIMIDAMKPVQEDMATQRARLSVYGLLYDDEARLRSADSFPEIKTVVPAKVIRNQGRLHSNYVDLRLVGTSADWFSLVDRPIIAGRKMLSQDVASSASVAVLTEKGARKLLATYNAIGQTVSLGNQPFEVIGIVQSAASGSGSGSDIQTPDEEVDAYIPIKVARERFGDITYRRTTGGEEREQVELHKIIVEVKSEDDVEKVAGAIRRMLETFHKKVDYKMSVPLELRRQREATRRTFNIVMGAIAGISLLVGGIGIMNIMLASVTERTREIGIRRAIGAKKRQIVGQFLIETVVLSTVGGLIGVAFGVIAPWVITLFSRMPTQVPMWSLPLSVGISMGIGIIFGLYPAVRAANLDPITALRHE